MQTPLGGGSQTQQDMRVLLPSPFIPLLILTIGFGSTEQAVRILPQKNIERYEMPPFFRTHHM